LIPQRSAFLRAKGPKGRPKRIYDNSLIEAVNRFGSFFYGTILAVFVLAFFFREVGDLAAVSGAVVSQVSVALCAFFTNTAWLWWNVVGLVIGVAASVLIQKLLPVSQDARVPAEVAER